jgi:hypothetical protein
MVVEAHVEEEWACGVDLDGGRAGSVDLDGGGGQHGTGVEAVDGASRRTRRRRGQWGAGVEAVGMALRRTRRRSGRWFDVMEKVGMASRRM